MHIIGLTGGSGSGKTTAAEILKNNNSYIIDCDKISRQTTEPGTQAYFEIKEAFGEKIIDSEGKINRRALGNIVFNDKNQLKRLEEISHRAITAEVNKQLETAKKESFDLIVIDAPLLIEAGLNRLVDRIWVFYADYDVRLKRIGKRDSLPEDAVKARFNNQTDITALAEYADEIIDTTGLDLKDMETKILKLKENLT